ncbi:UNVERIFIED_CONTAM: hypothetical protein Slati_0883100 [Sesamum latifolium]|uniref:Uncharacterized protein n=1 Tax=Sesamum latifolium TaxID=2727402 RepID=A0AAW2XNG7_9LAMI
MAIVCSALASIRGSCAPEIAIFTWFKDYATVPSTPHQSRVKKGLVETVSSMPSTKRPPRQGVPLQAKVWADELNWHLDSLPAYFSDGYVVNTNAGSWSWRKIVRLRNQLLGHIMYTVGTGANTLLWNDPWHELGV